MVTMKVRVGVIYLCIRRPFVIDVPLPSSERKERKSSVWKHPGTENTLDGC
jgi:hypothetical protein